MAGIQIIFTPWAPFHARKDPNAIHRWLDAIGTASEEAFRNGMGQYPGPSAPGAWPNSRTGNLRRTIRSEVTVDEVTVGTSMHYSFYLRGGTSKMARRKMSDDALKEGIAKSQGALGRWVQWVHG